MKEFGRLIVRSIWNGLIAFLITALIILCLAIVVMSFVFVVDLLKGNPIQWYEIVAPILLFFGIGVAQCILDDF